MNFNALFCFESKKNVILEMIQAIDWWNNLINPYYLVHTSINITLIEFSNSSFFYNYHLN
jgi:hypothetical protein